MEELIHSEPRFEELTEQDAIAVKRLLSKFIASYTQKPEGVSDEQWLAVQFMEELPELSEPQAAQMASEVVSSIAEYDGTLRSVNEASAKGISKEQWLATQISKAASGVSVIQHGEYLSSIDTALGNANAQMMRTVTTNTGEISQCLNLDGFIAEQHHVNSFNANAALCKSKYFAEVKVPAAGETYGKNSFDVVILDSTSAKATPVHQYQVKYGADAQATIRLLRDHGEVTKYSNQTIVVPPEQVDEVQRAFPGKTVVSHIGGTDKVPVASTELSKAEAKELQFRTQQGSSIPASDWNSFMTKDLALQIGKSSAVLGVQAAAVTTGFSLAAQIVNGEGIDVDETVEAALKTGADAGVKAAVAGVMKAGAEKGILRLIPKGTPAGIIANIACVSIENIKLLSKAATGELTMTQTLDRMGRTSVSLVYGLGWGAKGSVIGAAALSWVPIVGPVVGGLVGGMVGHIAGSSFGQKVYEGVKTVAKGVGKVCKAAYNAVKKGWNKFKSLFHA